MTSPPQALPEWLATSPQVPGCRFLTASWRRGAASTLVTAVLIQREGERDPTLARLYDHETGREESATALHDLAFDPPRRRRLMISLFAAPLALALSVAFPWLGLPLLAVIGVLWARLAVIALAMDRHLDRIIERLGSQP
ncbi:MAG: hypothetical protein EAZ99_02300 [Alphaproteobacteria bacterium]|nr:hypothetical protein [Alphaproteobacteria bacterium]TAD91501.1 MAG: hypothetical protein EAZ99_02300 [Alphaproteobacteria bacterium]